MKGVTTCNRTAYQKSLTPGATYYNSSTEVGLELIRRVLDMFDCNNLSDLKGQVIYVLGEGNGLSFKPKGFKRPKFDNGKELLYEKVFKKFE